MSMNSQNEETDASKKVMLSLSTAAIFSAFALSLWVWGRLPADAQVAIHFRLDGSADTYVNKLHGLSVVPLLALGMLVLQIMNPALDRKRYLTSGATIILLTAVHFLIAFKALNNGINVANSVVLLMGAYLLGLALIQVRRASPRQTRITQQ